MRKLALAAAVWLLFDMWRVWTPSLITIFGQAASTPPEVIGAFAIGCMALPLVLVLVLRPLWERSGPVPALLVMALVARVVLGCGTSGDVQLYVSAAGMVCAATYLCLAAARFGDELVDGLLLGVAMTTTAQAALGGLHAVWRQDAWAWLEVVVIAVVVAFGLRSSGGETAAPRALGWLLFPALLVSAMTLANVGWASAAAGAWGPVAVVAGSWLAVVLPRLRPVWPAALVLVAAVGVDSLVTTSAGATPAWAGLLPLVGMPALAQSLGAVTGSGPLPDSVRPAASAAGGAIAWVLLLFAFYAGYDLGYTAPWIPVAVAVGIAAVAVGHGRRATDTSPGLPRGRVVAAAVVAVLLAGLGPLVTLRGPAVSDSDDALTLMAYNVRMGYGLSGRYDVQQVAEMINEQGADVVLLSEVDRAWLLNGGQDQLRILARLTGLHAAFGPASDQVWGDAILSRLPLVDVERHPFGSYGSLTGAQALLATVEWRGTDVRLVSTHFQPGGDELDRTTGQAGELAELMTAAAQEHDAVVAGGDLNTTPGSEAWRLLTSTGYADALAAARPLPTNPADRPADEIDHLFTTGRLAPRDPRTIDVTYSDHLPVLIDLVPAG